MREKVATFEVQYRKNPDRTLVAMHTNRIAPYVLALDGHLDRRPAFDALAAHLVELADLARQAC